MATRTSVDASGALCSLIGRSPNLIMSCLGCSRVCLVTVFLVLVRARGLRLLGQAGRRSLRGDELVEPLDFSLAGLEPELMKLMGIAIERAAGPRHGFTQTFPAFLDLTAAALQDAHPCLRRSAIEERQVYPEAV